MELHSITESRLKDEIIPKILLPDEDQSKSSIFDRTVRTYLAS